MFLQASACAPYTRTDARGRARALGFAKSYSDLAERARFGLRTKICIELATSLLLFGSVSAGLRREASAIVVVVVVVVGSLSLSILHTQNLRTNERGL